MVPKMQKNRVFTLNHKTNGVCDRHRKENSMFVYLCSRPGERKLLVLHPPCLSPPPVLATPTYLHPRQMILRGHATQHSRLNPGKLTVAGVSRHPPAFN
ncbi:hypothetical protein FKM82_007589 [Ascaphus truei]